LILININLFFLFQLYFKGISREELWWVDLNSGMVAFITAAILVGATFGFLL
jgi:hypothetical protein